MGFNSAFKGLKISCDLCRLGEEDHYSIDRVSPAHTGTVSLEMSLESLEAP